jgi:hypothetical protein
MYKNSGNLNNNAQNYYNYNQKQDNKMELFVGPVRVDLVGKHCVKTNILTFVHFPYILSLFSTALTTAKKSYLVYLWKRRAVMLHQVVSTKNWWVFLCNMMS